jgi:formate dehydrogenase iron-sulfur subunit
MNPGTPSTALLIDIPRCIGCHACDVMCKQIHNLPADPEPKLSATALTVVQERDGKFVRRLCMHCLAPSCVSVCPVGALQRTAEGPVVYVADRCFGCRYCMLACPFQVPAYEWNRVAPLVMKCDMCPARIARGGQPACAEACPVGATVFGTREAMLAEARKRIRENSGYVPRIYGAEEMGGTSVLFLSDVPFEQLGFVNPPLQQPLPSLTAAAIGEVPTVVLVGAALLSALYWITQRRGAVALAEPSQERS